jgi:putative transposase
MPSINTVKIYKDNAYYHAYNRGVEKRDVFLKPRDYDKFLEYLQRSAVNSSVKIHCFCLMNNHYHLLISQKYRKSITKLMHSLSCRYTSYFNIKYERVGSLFQGTYKARLIISDEDLINTSFYIHNNPRKDQPGLNLKEYPYSSYPAYLRKSYKGFISTKEITAHFAVDSYKNELDKHFNESK